MGVLTLNPKPGCAGVVRISVLTFALNSCLPGLPTQAEQNEKGSSFFKGCCGTQINGIAIGHGPSPRHIKGRLGGGGGGGGGGGSAWFLVDTSASLWGFPENRGAIYDIIWIIVY